MHYIEENIQALFDFAIERQKVYYKKEVLKSNPPWTEDFTLKTYLFCNVRRQNDRLTKVYIDLTKKMLAEDFSKQEILLNTYLYRIFNTENFFEVFGLLNIKNFLLPSHLTNLIQKSEYKQKAFPVWGTAYQTSPNMMYLYKSKIKSSRYIHNAYDMFKDGEFLAITNNISLRQNVSQCLEALKALPGVGPFLSQQIFNDLTYIPGYLNGNMNINEFVNAGPGCPGTSEFIRGSSFSKYENVVEDIHYIYGTQNKYLKNYESIMGLDYTLKTPEIRLSDLEHLFCEFRKYLNLKAGIGKKRYYKGKV